MKSETKRWSAPSFQRRQSVRRADDDIRRKAEPDRLIEAICMRPEMSSELARKLRNRQRLGSRNRERVAEFARRAVYDIPTTEKGYFLTPNFVDKPGSCAIGISATTIPHVKTSNGTLFLCMHDVYSDGPLKAWFAISKLAVDGDNRTVVITGHAVDRLSERLGIKGSYVAFIAESMNFQRRMIFEQVGRAQRLLAIFDATDKTCAYCPVAECECELFDHGKTFDDDKGILAMQNRWLLKTVLAPEMVDTQRLRRLEEH